MRHTSKHDWLWRGSSSDIRGLPRACAIAPLFVLILCLPILLFWVANPSGRANNFQDTTPLIFCGLALLISYGMTIVVGLPWFLFLSREGFAGFLPTLFPSVLPLCFVWAAAHAQRANNYLWGHLYLLACGLAPAVAFWWLARMPNERFHLGLHALTFGLTGRRPGGTYE